MIRSFRCVALVLPTALAACATAARTSQPLSDVHAAAIRDSVQQTLQLFRHYSTTRQWDSLVTLYADDPRFRWIENGAVRYRSQLDIRAALAALPPNTSIESTYRDTEITALAPGLASVTTLFQTRFVSPPAPPFEFGGAITMTLIHSREGWRILNGHTSSPIRRP